MALPRIIPVLLLQDQGLVKTMKFENAVYVGDPVNTVKLFNEKQADEIILLDIDASRKGTEPNFTQLEEIASECFMPLAYGGGVKRLDQIRKLIQCGIEKVIINSHLLNNPGFLEEAVKAFGSSTVIAAMDVTKNILGKYKVYNHILRKTLIDDPQAYASRLEAQGAGEIFVNAVYRDGTLSGYDIPLVASMTGVVSIPVIACGGCSSLTDIHRVLFEGKAQAAAAGSYFVFHGPHRAVLISYPSSAELLEIEKAVIR